ncbi:MAG: hypothetical protein WCG63_09065 [Opitutaceae bacterium]
MKSHASSYPKLSLWIFFLSDVALLGAAAFLATRAARPLSGETVFLITALVLAGALVALVPLVARYERIKNETLDDRQRALETLARTLTAAAEQISIATAGLDEITGLTQKNLKKTEQLTAAFTASAPGTPAAAKPDTRSHEQLSAAAEQLTQAAARLTQLESTTRQQLAATRETLAQIIANPAPHPAPDPQPLATTPTGLEDKLAATLAALDAKIATLSSAVVAPSAPASGETNETRRPRKVRREEAPVEPVSAPAALESPAEPVATPPAPVEPAPAPFQEFTAAVSEPTAEPTPAPVLELTEPAPTPANLTLEIITAPAATETPAPEGAPSPTSEPAQAPVIENQAVETPKTPRKRAPKKLPAPADESTSASTPEVAPAPGPTVPPSPVETTTPAEPVTEEPITSTLEPTPKPVPAPAPSAPPAVDEFVQFAPDELTASSSAAEFKLHSPDATVSSMTADGATRLLATAYIGIGNRLFIRGEGPGLSWEKGVPLAFVSIGKWRWETTETSATVTFKLYKNDTIECATLGEQSIAPGHLTEVTAAF